MGKNLDNRGFTILELLVASSVSIILIGLFLYVSANIMDAWRQSRDSLSANAKARIVLNTLTMDLESAILGHDRGVWLACDLLETTATSSRWERADYPQNEKPNDATSLEIDFANPELGPDHYRFGVAGVWLRFFASPTDAAGSGDGGDVNAVAYQMIRRKPHSRSSEPDESYNLYRSIVRSDHTLEEVKEDEGYFIDQFDGRSYEGQPGEVTTPRNDSSLLVRDVVDLGAVFYRKNALGQDEALFPTTDGVRQFRVPRDGIPDYADVYVRILNEEGAKQINAYERGLIPSTQSDFWWETVNRFSTIYTKRIHFKSGTP